MSSVKATQLRPGMVIQHEGQLFTVFSTEHRTPGNKRGSMQTRMKNLKTGAIIDYRFRAEEFVDRAILDEIEYERSEEHTSELQSRLHLVCRLLLEKKHRLHTHHLT